MRERRCPYSGKVGVNGSTLFYSGHKDAKHYKGIVIMPNSTAGYSVLNFISLFDRTMMIQLYATTKNLNLIQVYARTANKFETENEKCYAKIRQMLSSTKNLNFLYLNIYTSKLKN